MPLLTASKVGISQVHTRNKIKTDVASMGWSCYFFCFFPTGFHKFICFEKTDVASMDWSCYFPFVSTALITGYVSESDPMAYRSYPWDVALHGGFIALLFSMFSPTRISVWSCSHGFSMCEIRSQELADSPPKMCVIGAKKTLSRSHSQVSIQAPLFDWNQVLF